ncbi:UvrD-helicase domain-containing protein, partial [Candidatus Parcubacteria bacterium]|nr:UvrD-helicase domain-containing protein [Candidatus Parcubacteria bacterium]
AQYKIINLLSRKYNNIFVVGDDWQSIYKWRGADLRNILEFEKDYPGAKIILLEQNYRSTQEILDVSYGIISKNINRKEKKLFSSKKSGQPIVVYEAADEKGEAEFIVSQIAKLNAQKGLKLKDIAVLYRTNAQSRSIEETFLRYGVPYKIVGGIKFYMRKEIKDLIAYFRLIQNNNDILSFERIVNIPKRGIGKTTYEKIINEARKNNNSVIETIFNYGKSDIAKKRMENLLSFADIIQVSKEKSKEMNIVQLLDHILKAIDYKNYIIDGTEEGDLRWENVKELFTAVEKYSKLKAEEAIKLFIEEVALASDLDSVDDKQDTVTLMTLHSAKGLEYDTIFIIGLEEGLLPHSMSIDNPIEIEEERRLCYVGITRA